MKESTLVGNSDMRIKRGMTIDDIFKKVKEMIYYNQLAPGQKIIYSDLAKSLQVSATPVIQSLKRLESLRLVKYIPNKGYFVDEIGTEEAKQLYSAREALETHIIPAVIQNITPEKIENIRETFKKYEKTNRRLLILVDAQFHLKVAEQAENEVIYQLLRDIFERIYLKYRPEYMDERHERNVVEQHHDLLKSIENKDVKGTIKILRKHIKYGMDSVVNSLAEDREMPI